MENDILKPINISWKCNTIWRLNKDVSEEGTIKGFFEGIEKIWYLGKRLYS